MRCPKCGREVDSFRCGHCGSRISPEQSELYGAVASRLWQSSSSGGRSSDATHEHHGQIATSPPSLLNGERYTPPELIALVRDALGEIDLDPASSRAANKVVKAKSIFTKEKDGLTQRWHGRVFLNPPFDDWPTWIAKLDDEIGAKRVTQAVMVGPSNITAFRPLLERKVLLCLLDSRPKFYDPGADEYIDPPFGSLLCYVGNAKSRFIRTFRRHGKLLEAI